MARKRLLLIDDEPELVALVKERLELEDYDVLPAYNGTEGFYKATVERPDLIILDLVMPGMNGYDVCRKLKIDARYKDIPVIMFTAKFQPNDIDFGKAMGADAYLTKPVGLKTLSDLVRSLLGKERGRVTKPAKPRGRKRK